MGLDHLVDGGRLYCYLVLLTPHGARSRRWLTPQPQPSTTPDPSWGSITHVPGPPPKDGRRLLTPHGARSRPAPTCCRCRPGGTPDPSWGSITIQSRSILWTRRKPP